MELLPEADALYACDMQWWTANVETHHHYAGLKFSYDQKAIDYNAIPVPFIKSKGNEGGIGKTGGNSGHQAINLALMLGAERILLLGFDMQATGGRLHWHPDHAVTNPTDSLFATWRKNYEQLALEVTVPIINCSRETALTCFPRKALEECL